LVLMTDIDEVMSRVGKKTAARIQAAKDIEIEYLETPIPSLNRALNGGLPYGRQVLFYGNKSCGKSSILLQMIAQAQRDGKSCLWVDAEKTFDPAWAEKMGVDVSKLKVLQYSDSMRVTNTISEFMVAGIDVVVLDSISSVIPMSYFEKDSVDLKGLEATRQMGSSAKDMAAAISLWNQSNSHTLLILISQIRNNLGGMYVSQTPTHGHAPKFFSSTVVKLFSSESMKQAKMGKIQVGDYIEEVPIGREVTWTLENSKTSKPFQTGTYDFYFAGDRLGADTLADIIDSAVKYGLIKKSGPGWFELDGVKIQGRDNLVNHLLSLPDDLEELKGKVLSYGA